MGSLNQTWLHCAVISGEEASHQDKKVNKEVTNGLS